MGGGEPVISGVVGIAGEYSPHGWGGIYHDTVEITEYVVFPA